MIARAFMAVCAILALLTACTKTITVEKPVIQYVEKRVECPSKAERERLRALRPTPLLDTIMPPTAVERNAKVTAQLGIYEAPGGWADQVDSVLDRCQAK